MIKNKGVYTTKCPTCTRSIVMHVLSDGSISPDKCKECFLEFECVEYGEQRNTFVIIPKAKKKILILNQEAEETKKTGENEAFSLTKKATKKSFKW